MLRRLRKLLLNMKLKFIFVFLLMLFFSSCKKTEVSGTIYSRHGFPVTNADVILRAYGESKVAKSTSNKAKTDNNGNFYFSFTSKKKYYYTVGSNSDSGLTKAEIINSKKVNKIDLYIE